jgi:hypothetical protein
LIYGNPDAEEEFAVVSTAREVPEMSAVFTIAPTCKMPEWTTSTYASFESAVHLNDEAVYVQIIAARSSPDLILHRPVGRFKFFE